MTRVHLGLGSNLADPRAILVGVCNALNHLEKSRLLRLSSLYRSAPVGDSGHALYLNAAALMETDLGPEALLKKLQGLETENGRVPPGEPGRSGARPLDLDILSFGDQVIHTAELQIPHPSMPFRSFVLVPLSEIDAFWNHPVLKKTAGELLAKLAPVYDVHWVEPPPWKKP